MFERMPMAADEERRPVEIVVNDITVVAREGDTVAVALLNAGIGCFRRTAWGAPRGPLCLMGVCFDCLLEVDGRPNVQSCLVEVRSGLKVRSMAGVRRIGEPA